MPTEHRHRTYLNLEEDGPTVVEIPKGCGPGTVNDAYFRFVTDMGIPGPDAGKGGKYLILPPGPLETWFDKSWQPGDIELVK